MASADAQGYAALPALVRRLISREYLLPVGGWHQMFGRGIEIQGECSAMREQGSIMLLQLTYDDLMRWSFGDNGVYQFWISPTDLTGTGRPQGSRSNVIDQAGRPTSTAVPAATQNQTRRRGGIFIVTSDKRNHKISAAQNRRCRNRASTR